MRQQLTRWLAGAALALAIAYGLLFGGTSTPNAQAADPTPTAQNSTNGNDPGGSGGGHGGG